MARQERCVRWGTTQQQFGLDPDAFRRSANVTRALSDKLAGIWTELANGADAIGTC
jgi:hypothetical protein